LGDIMLVDTGVGTIKKVIVKDKNVGTKLLNASLTHSIWYMVYM
jgi:hypothetical protein